MAIGNATNKIGKSVWARVKQSAEYDYEYTYGPSVVKTRTRAKSNVNNNNNNNNRRFQDYHYPYRPKYPAHHTLGFCRIKDFDFGNNDRLGKGGFGQVFRAVHKSGKVVAIKYTSSESIQSKPKHVENEETIHRSLDNPFISKLLCTMKNSKNDIFFALEYFPGGNLSKQLSQLYPLNRNLLVKYVVQIILALRYLHSQCIIYRDLKAENIMIDEKDNIKLIDFGLSVFDCDNEQSNLAGTLEYVAPEVAGRLKYGRSSDYYSLAVLLYLLQMKRLPYRHKSDDKDQFTKQLAEGKLIIPPTGNPQVDQLIGVLADRNAERRWDNVYKDFEKFKQLPFFENFQWSIYEDF